MQCDIKTMFSLRQYHSLNEEDESVCGKNVLYSDDDTTIVTCSSAHSTPSLASTHPNVSIATSTTATVTSSSRTNTISPPSTSSVLRQNTTSPKASHSNSHSPSISLQSIKAAWKTLTTLGFGSQRLPHLERQEPSSSRDQHDYRYTQFPTTLTTNTTTTTKKSKDSPFHHYHHLHIAPLARSNSQSHRTPSHSPEPLTLAKCLRRHREKQQSRALSRKSKSDNALQRIGVNLNSISDQNLHKVCLVGGSSTTSNSIFSNVQLSGGSGDSCGSFSSGSGGRYHLKRSRQSRHPSRSRSLERAHGTRIHWHRQTSTQEERHTRSLERNHKFRIDLRNITSGSRDLPPTHPAPPPPLKVNYPIDSADDSAGNISICSSSTNSSTSSSGSTFNRSIMEGGNPIGASFINKPPRGWLHPDQQLAEEGICYGVRYIGALEVNTSMKSLNFDTRSLIAKECISKVCEAAGLKTADRKRKVVKSIGRILGERPQMEYAGSNITLTITSTALTLTTLESCQVVACHEMPNISFASGGDPDTLDFIAYVAKDIRFGRACFVLECGGGLAQDVITTIGQAFELRFKEYLKRTPMSVQYTNVKSDNHRPNGDSWNEDREYYNDLPNKIPPETTAPPVPPLPKYDDKPTDGAGSQNVRGNDNLIDFSAEPVKREPEYVNDAVIKQSGDVKDPFDMQPFSMQLTQLGNQTPHSTQTLTKTLPLSQRLQLQQEPWFHGSISRREAEILLKHDGDFLVRESQGTVGQYVLTGIQNNIKKHLLLVDPEGVVRTKSRTFDSVSHLINYHRNNELPIVSSESALLLRNPVHRL